MNKILRNTVLSTSAALALFFVGCGSNTTTTSMSEQYQFKGVLNTDFANTGYAVYDSGNGDKGNDVVVDKNGNIYVAGEANKDMAIWKYKSDGTLDSSFGTDGVVTYGNDGKTEDLRGITLDSNNNIYVVGTSNNSGSNDIVLLKYNSSGTLDTSFGSSGVATYDNNTKTDYGYDLVIDEDNNCIYVTGATYNSNSDMILLKYTTSGIPDTSFGDSGIVTHDNAAGATSPGEDYGYKIALDSNNNIFVAGNSTNSSNKDIVVWKYTSSGTPDTSFGSNGIVKYNGEDNDYAWALTLDLEDNIYVAGETKKDTEDMIVLKYTSSGTPDTSFGTNGVVTHDNAAGATTAGKDYAGDIALDFEKNVYLTGYSYNSNSNEDMVIWKYKSDGTLDTSFNSTGYVVHGEAAGGSGTDKGYGITFNSSKTNIYVAGYSTNGKSTPDTDMVIWNYQ